MMPFYFFQSQDCLRKLAKTGNFERKSKLRGLKLAEFKLWTIEMEWVELAQVHGIGPKDM